MQQLHATCVTIHYFKLGFTSVAPNSWARPKLRATTNQRQGCTHAALAALADNSPLSSSTASTSPLKSDILYPSTVCTSANLCFDVFLILCCLYYELYFTSVGHNLVKSLTVHALQVWYGNRCCTQLLHATVAQVWIGLKAIVSKMFHHIPGNLVKHLVKRAVQV